MGPMLFNRFAGPLVALGAMLAVACLASTWYLNHLQSELARTVRHDAAQMEAASELQVRLRQLRLHAVIFAADPSPARNGQVASDRRLVAAALAETRAACREPDDLALLETIERGYRDFHFYTMNRADLVYAICHMLGLRSRPARESAAAAA